MKTERINVFLNFGTEHPAIEIGELVVSDRLIHFKCSDAYLKSPYELSPFKTPKSSEIYTGDPRLFEGLPGLFYDALPDTWGRLITDRVLSTKGINTSNITALDRLVLVGKNGPGALQFLPEYKNEQPKHNIDLDVFAHESNEIISGSDSEVIEELFHLGGSSGGARPKIELLVNPATKVLKSHSAAEGFENWIIKFPSRFDEPDIAHIEYAYYLMAKAAGISISTSKLFTGNSGKKYFGTKRFDRQQDKHLHVHSVAGMLHDDYRYSQLDYGHILDAGFNLTQRVKTHEEILRLAAFNLYTHNRDDHSKNFSFLMDETGEWSFAPAYDLTFSSSSHGHHSTTFAGEGLNPSSKQLLELAKTFDIRNAKEIIEEVKTAASNWVTYADKAEVTNASRKKITKVLDRLIVG